MDLPSEWKHNTNIYEVNVRQYTEEGTFRAFEKEMPRLKAMGVKTLWFMPITPISQKVKKGTMGSPYAAHDYTSINPEFGTMEDFKHMVDEAHNLALKLLSIGLRITQVGITFGQYSIPIGIFTMQTENSTSLPEWMIL